MLEGITVLNEFTATIFNDTAFLWGFFGTAIAAMIICIIVACATDDDVWLTIGALLIIPSALFGAGCGECFFATEETQYQVTINEEVSMTEFNERYEIIEQNGQIFTIRERNDENVAG